MIDMVAPDQLPKLLPTPVTTDGKSVDVANQVATRNSLQLQSITAILGMPEDTWMKTDLSGNKDRQVGEAAKRRAANLPTPTVSDQYTGNLASTQQKPGSMHSVTLAQVFHKPDLFPTPVAADWKNGRPGQGYGANLPQATESLMPTPKALDGVKGNLKTSQERLDSGHQVDLPNVAIDLLDSKETNWGKFEPAIRRWEAILGRLAPEPTKPDGKDGNHRLSSKFTEWMMGLPDGWITGHDLKRNDELKLAGNGVVPQQAELALRLLLELPEKREK
jgi:DNA (cytosine-5)-methyltransferase 1